MEKWEIIVSAICVYGPLLVWLSLNNIQHGKKMAVLEKSAQQTDSSLTHIAKEIDKMNIRLDLFLKNEIDTLKELLLKK